MFSLTSIVSIYRSSPSQIFDISRILQATIGSKNPVDRFSFLLEEVNSLSVTVSSQGTQLAVLANDLLVTRCQMLEENCGRVNSDNLHHFIVLGCPFFPLTNTLQDQLRQQVYRFL